MKSVNIPKRREIIEKSKSAIEESCVPRSAFEAVTKDVGIIPGDNKGAAGFDSHLFAHLARNWSTKKKCSTVSNKKISKLNILLMQRQKKHFNNRKINEKKRSEITSNHLYKIRFKWTSDEDQILLLWKLGTMIIKQVKSHAFLSYGIKDVVKSIFGKFYRVKSIDNYLRRIRYLMRYSSIENSIAVLYNEIKADEEIQNIFKKDIEKQHELYDTKKYKAMRDLIVTNIKKLIMLLRARNTTIDTQCVSSRIKKILPDVKQEECLNANNIEMVYKYSDIPCFQEDIVPDHDYRFTTEEISMSVVTSLIHSSLVNQSSDPRVSFGYLQAFKQFPEDILKQSFNIIKDNNIITCSQYHKASLQILLSTSHIIQSKTYNYSSKYSSILIGTTDIGRYVDAFKAYSDIKEYLSEQKLLLLFPTYGLCPALTSLCLTNVVDLSIEFDKKYLEYMLDENLDEGSKCLKNTLKRMRSRHFDLLSSSNDSVDYVKIITSVTKQLKNYQVICKLKQSFQNFEEEIDLVSKHIFSSKPTFKPQVEFIGKLNELSKQILEFCKINAQLGVSQLEIKKHFKDVSPSILTKSLWYLIEKDLILKAGISVPAFVHYQFTDLWLVKIPTLNLPIINNSDHSTIIENENNIIMTELALKDSIEPPFKRIRLDLKENVNTENLNYLKVRPWTRLDLSINKENLKTFLNSVLSKIIIKPGIYLKTLKKEYELIIPPIYIRELVEMLESLKCIKMIHFKNACKPSFFSNPSPLNHNLIFSDVKGLEEESLIMLEPTLDCEIRFGYFSCKFDSYTTE